MQSDDVLLLDCFKYNYACMQDRGKEMLYFKRQLGKQVGFYCRDQMQTVILVPVPEYGKRDKLFSCLPLFAFAIINFYKIKTP